MVLDRLARWFKTFDTADPDPDQAGAGAPGSPGAAELLDAVQRSTRTTAKLALKLEDLERKLEGGLAELRSTLGASRAATCASPDELLDAMDLIDQAATRSAALDPALAEGLRGVLERLDRHLAAQGLVRSAPIGAAPDPRLFRVVGSEADASLPDGVVARVVRAAVTQGDTLLREGEVLTNRRPD